MTGLELLKAPEATADEIADIISAPCPPTIPAHCDGVSCRECWLTWLTGEPPEEKGPSDEQTGTAIRFNLCTSGAQVGWCKIKRYSWR